VYKIDSRAQLPGRAREARIVIEQWRWEYNTQRPHSRIGYSTSAEVGIEARASMTRESGTDMIESPGATLEGAMIENGAEVHRISTGNLSLPVVRGMGTLQWYAIAIQGVRSSPTVHPRGTVGLS
jgi:hypothetical protein